MRTRSLFFYLFFYIMGRSPRTNLDEKDLKALQLYSEGKKPKEIAAAIGVGEDYIYQMSTGDTGSHGFKANLFKERWTDIRNKQEDQIAEGTKRTRGLAISLIEKILSDYDGKALKEADKKMVGFLTNSVAKLAPNVKINNMAISYTSTFSLEELAHEYGRLRAAAEGPSDSRAVSEDEQKRSGEVYRFADEGSSAQEE